MLTGDLKRIGTEISDYVRQLEEDNRNLKSQLNYEVEERSKDQQQIVDLQRELDVIDSTAIDLENKLHTTHQQKADIEKEMEKLTKDFQAVEEVDGND